MPPVLPKLLAAAAVAVLALALLPAGASADSSATPSADGARLTINVSVNRFDGGARTAAAQGTVTATLTDLTGATTRIRQPVRLTQVRGGGCKILTLVLEELDLRLLGLNVHLDKVDLRVTGRRSGGVLGVLFCRLASSASASERAAATRALNARLAKRPLRPFRVTVPLTPKATTSQAQTTCQVLNLVLGPLDLDLLGLIVQLNKVKLDITATRGGGVLGDLFCELGGQQQSQRQQ
jgi:hypothetical protein